MIVLLHDGHNNNVYFEVEKTEFAEVEAVEDDVTLYEGDTKCNILLMTFDEDDD